MTNITIERAKLALTDAKRSAMLMHNSEGHEVVCIEPNLWKQLRKAIEDLAAPVQEPLMVDIHPPTTQRDRWMYEQGRLAERDPRSHTTTPAAQPAYTKEDIDRAFSAGIAEGEKLSIEAQPAPVQPVAWIERWYGSGPDRGWWVWEDGLTHGNAIAFIGESEAAERLTSIIVEKHNAAITTPPTQPAPVQEQALPEFFAELEYNSPDWDIFACVYRRRTDATPELVHREQLPRQAPAAQSPNIPSEITCPFCESTHVPGWLHDMKCDALGITEKGGVACKE